MDVIQNMSREELRAALVRLDDKCRALAQERDAERRLSAQLKREVDANIARAEKAEAERNDMRAERDRISEYWKECAASRDAWIKKHDAMQAERDAVAARAGTAAEIEAAIRALPVEEMRDDEG